MEREYAYSVYVHRKLISYLNYKNIGKKVQTNLKIDSKFKNHIKKKSSFLYEKKKKKKI
jgi:hypothetical protein